MSSKPKIIVLDDDPTGSQTVHSCLLLTRWDVDTLRLGLKDDSPIFFVLTNTRALTPEAAAQVTREVCHNLKIAIEAEKIQDFLVVSRSDSTLRGHYPVETDVIAEELGPFDAHFLVPAFFEGGRITIDSVHYLIVNGSPTPVHETEFAKDSVFAYHHSYLPMYVEEKTKGRISANTVERFLLKDIPKGSVERLMQLSGNQCCVVDGETQADLNKFAADILTAASQGKRFLFRSAASILTALAALPPQPIAAEDMAEYVREGKPGAVIVGSHVKKTTEQLEKLLQEPGIVGIEVDVSHLLDDDPPLPPLNKGGESESPLTKGGEAVSPLDKGGQRGVQRAALLEKTLQTVHNVHNEGKTPIVYTSRQELTFPDTETRLKFGIEVSSLLMDVVRGLPKDIGFLISKGGITSNDVLSTGLALTSARLLGQILAGCSMVRTPENHPLFPNLPVVLFPGNVGDADALATVYRRLSK
ncbi:four-carbon acid sugar kinase family protein [Phormidium sp. LEGE 05292]|uniref:four-carbon acid sugar kinase family protein n=1 Tax=[Phormidium] sp. LEGE 05292 TaxID=767427 RepID=UPI001882D7CB|nr:four-carbon acid sugar kinase family protein [Phormidium sp. LEGE 05292]MBE9227817.1 four-carbon acid sugar kinase family protein [Phormidium sp. LEGE 05292]